MTLNEVESGGSLTLNNGLWTLRWETDRSVREKAVQEKRCVGLCVSRGSVTLASPAVAVDQRMGVLKSYRSLLC